MGSSLISDLRVALAGDNLTGLDANESFARVRQMDAEGLIRAREAVRALRRQWDEEYAAAERQGREALQREVDRRVDEGRGFDFDEKLYLVPPLERHLVKWQDRRRDVEHTQLRLHQIDDEIRQRFHRGEVPSAVAADLKALRAAARAFVTAAAKKEQTEAAPHVVKALAELETATDRARDAKQKADAAREHMKAEWGLFIDTPDSELAAQA